jgi:voltage-gated potassium channel
VGTREDRWERRLSAPMLVASVLVLPAIVLEAGDYGSGWSTLGQVLNWGTWLAFAAELVIMLVVVDDRRRWMRAHPVEVLVTLFSPPVLPGPLQAIRVLRLLRLLRLLRTAQVMRRMLTPAGVRDAALLTTLVVLGGGVAFTEVETGQHLSPWDGVWWAMSTITTVGYGDVTPATTAGRIIAIVVMVAGIGFVALFTASIAQRFVAHEASAERADATRDDEILRELRALHARLDRIERAGDATRADP